MYRRHQSKETRERISRSMKGPNNHFFGKHHSGLTRHTISEKNKGRVPWNKGLKMSMETRKKLSISHMGIYPSKAFSGSLTPEAKYWVGFLITDGNVSIKEECLLLHFMYRKGTRIILTRNSDHLLDLLIN